MGTTLNQLAYRANEATKIGCEKELAALMAMAVELRGVTTRIAETIVHVIGL